LEFVATVRFPPYDLSSAVFAICGGDMETLPLRDDLETVR